MNTETVLSQIIVSVALTEEQWFSGEYFIPSPIRGGAWQSRPMQVRSIDVEIHDGVDIAGEVYVVLNGRRITQSGRVSITPASRTKKLSEGGAALIPPVSRRSVQAHLGAMRHSVEAVDRALDLVVVV